MTDCSCPSDILVQSLPVSVVGFLLLLSELLPPILKQFGIQSTGIGSLIIQFLTALGQRLSGNTNGSQTSLLTVVETCPTTATASTTSTTYGTTTNGTTACPTVVSNAPDTKVSSDKPSSV